MECEERMKGSTSRGRRWRGTATRLIRAVAAAVLLALAAAVPAQALGASRGEAASRSGTERAAAPGTARLSVAVLDMVVLADESGSETPRTIADEKAAVGKITQSLLSAASRVTVIGFGGVNNVAPNQVPTDVACVPTIASGPANLAYLASCVGRLHRRSEEEGDDTDYAAALAQAMSYLAPGSSATPPSPARAIKVILMMTDGAPDVHRDTQQYGQNWQLGEQAAVHQQLVAGKSDGVELWPLGFGTDIGAGVTEPQALEYLQNMAAAAAPATCNADRSAGQPHATWVSNPDDLTYALGQLYAQATCVGTSVAESQSTAEQVAELAVSIPEIVSAAVISVSRGDPAVAVSFIKPDGTPWTDASAISGQDTSVEALHLTSLTQDEVGRWTIRLVVPPGLTNEIQSSTVAVFWQGSTRAIVTVNPPSAQPGQKVSVNLDVLGPAGLVTDPGALHGVVVGVTVTGDGLPGRVPVSVRPVVGSPGEFTGTFTVPSQVSTLTFTGSVSGPGLYVEQIPAIVGVGKQTPGFTATPSFASQGSVPAGGSIFGQVSFTNQTGSAKRLRLTLHVGGASASLSSPPGPITVAPGTSPSVPFTVAVAAKSPAGTATVQVEVVDAASGQVYNIAVAEFGVTRAPGFIATYLWEVLGLVVLIVLTVLVALWWRRDIRRRMDVRGLRIVLRRGGVAVGRALSAEDRYDEVFPFIIRGEDSPAPRLDHPSRDATTVYLVRRSRHGMVRLWTPEGARPYEVELNGPGLKLGNGIEVSFYGSRVRDHGPASLTPADPSPASLTPAEPPSGAVGTPPPPPLNRDDWL